MHKKKNQRYCTEEKGRVTVKLKHVSIVSVFNYPKIRYLKKSSDNVRASHK